MHMKYLTHTEIRKESIVMIEFENGRKEPYYITNIGPGTITKATMLIGHLISPMFKIPEYLFKESGYPDQNRFYIQNDDVKGKDKEVKGYRLLTKEEKDDLRLKIKDEKHFQILLPLLE